MSRFMPVMNRVMPVNEPMAPVEVRVGDPKIFTPHRLYPPDRVKEVNSGPDRQAASRSRLLLPTPRPPHVALCSKEREAFPLSLSTTSVGNGRQRRSLADRKSTRLNSSHLGISYAVFCL